MLHTRKCAGWAGTCSAVTWIIAVWATGDLSKAIAAAALCSSLKIIPFWLTDVLWQRIGIPHTWARRVMKTLCFRTMCFPVTVLVLLVLTGTLRGLLSKALIEGTILAVLYLFFDAVTDSRSHPSREEHSYSPFSCGP